MNPRVLVVDDETSMVEMLSFFFSDQGFDVSCANSVEQAREAMAEKAFDLVLCDILMPDGNGLELLRQIKKENPKTAVIMMTAYTSSKSAVEAMRLGAYNYVSKPFNLEELKVQVESALEKSGLASEKVYVRRELEESFQFDNIVGQSPRMQEIFSLIERVANTPTTVLIQGESGTGKELIARAIHFSGPRKKERFMSINCGALPENLLESELFGHERGAFTGAVRNKKGLFLEADQGTLFLDEIGEMSSPMQVKLLRALQERTVRRVGGHREEAFDVRIIAATNRNLLESTREGTFREDLFYRINVIPIRLPSLHQRREDISLLVEFFIKKYSLRMGIEPKRISMEALLVLEAYPWPGNVRELENTIERVLALSPAVDITSGELPSHIRSSEPEPEHQMDLPEEGIILETYLDGIRRRFMEQALERADGVQTRAAELLAMSFRSFRYYSKKLKIDGRDSSHPALPAPPPRNPAG